jgi:hypothetical protein
VPDPNPLSLAEILARQGLTLPPDGAQPPAPPPPAAPPSLASAMAAQGLQAPPGAPPQAAPPPSPFSLVQPFARPGAGIASPQPQPNPFAGQVRQHLTDAELVDDMGTGGRQHLPGPAKGKRDLSELSFAKGEAGSESDAAKRAAIALTPRLQNVPATETPRIAPGRIAGIEGSQAEQEAALRDLGAANVRQTEDAGTAAALHGKTLADQKADIEKKAADRDTFIADQQAKMDKLSADVAEQKIDPDRWWHNQKTGSKIAYAIAAGLGGFLEGFRGTPNRAMETIRSHIDADISAQREAIESKKGRVKDMQGLLAETYRRFGNMEQAESAARAIALQQVDSEQQAYAASSASEKVQAESRVQSAQLQEAKQKELAGLYAYTPAHAAVSGPTLADYRKYAEHWSMSDQKVPLMDFGEWAQSVAGGAGHGAAAPPNGTPQDRYKKYVDTVVEKGETPLSLDEWQKKTSGEIATAPGSSVPKPESTAWSWTHAIPGGPPQSSDAFAKEIVHARYNAAMTKGVLDKYGRGAERNEALIEKLQKAYTVNPGDTQETIDRKTAAAQADLGMAAFGGSAAKVGFTPGVK